MRLFALAVMATVAGVAHARPCTFYGSYGPAVYQLGSSFDDTYRASARAAGVAALRVNFRVDAEPEWNERILAAYDRLLWDAYAGGFDVLGLVANEAVAGLGQDAWNAPPTTSDGRNDYTQAFVDVTRILFERYGDQIKYWEIWNEPNACASDRLADCERAPQTAGGSFLRADLYAKLLAEVWVQNQAVIQAKGLHLVSGGLYAHDVGGNAVVYAADDYMNEVYANSVWAYLQKTYGRPYPWDAFGYHVYTTLYGPPVQAATISSYLDGIAAARAQNGDASPIWMTEFGWLTTMVSEAQQAQDLDTEYTVLEGRDDVGRAFVFRVDEWQGWGVYRDDWTPKPAVAVLQAHASGCVPEALPVVADLAGVVPDAGSDDAADDADGPADRLPRPDGGSGGGGCALAGAAAPSGALLVGAALLALVACVRPRRRRAGGSGEDRAR